MSCRYYIWPIILLFSSCAAFLPRSEFKKGLESYKKKNFLAASEYFNSYYTKNPESETTLYYLYDCCQKLNQPELGLQVLQQLAKIGSEDENVYLNLFYYYRKNSRCKDLYRLLMDLKPSIKERLDKQYILTRRLYAEIVSGASSEIISSDPMVFAILQGYLPLSPDGKLYDDDPITQANLIILLDRLVEPIYPGKFFKMKNISNHSFLYLPYMRLVNLGILKLNPDLNPTDYATISTAVTAIANLKKRGLIESR